MIKKVTRKVTKEVIETVSSAMYCDMCGEEITVDYYDVDDIEMKRKKGREYPEGGSGTEEWLDLCGKCWEKVIEVLEGMGAKVQKKDWDW